MAIKSTDSPGGGLQTPARVPYQRCSSVHANALVREMAILFDAQLPPDRFQEKGRFSKTTIHSGKGWLNTLAGQAKFDREDRKMLLHWCTQELEDRYHRAFSVAELAVRMQLVRLLATRLRPLDDPHFPPWHSRPEGHVPMRPPDLLRLPLLPGEQDHQGAGAAHDGAFRF